MKLINKLIRIRYIIMTSDKIIKNTDKNLFFIYQLK